MMKFLHLWGDSSQIAHLQLLDCLRAFVKHTEDAAPRERAIGCTFAKCAAIRFLRFN